MCISQQRGLQVKAKDILARVDQKDPATRWKIEGEIGKGYAYTTMLNSCHSIDSVSQGWGHVDDEREQRDTFKPVVSSMMAHAQTVAAGCPCKYGVGPWA